MNIVLTAINAKYIHSNLAVYSLAAYAKQYQESIHIAEYTINQNVDDILMDLYKKAPDVLCLSCYIWNLPYVEIVVGEVKKLFPALPIWLGGPEVSYDSKVVLQRLPEVTGVMMGEGEETFLELCAHYLGASEKKLSDIKGITYRKEDGDIQENDWREVLDLSTVPFVYSNIEDFEHKIIYYETSRGCPFSCSYCLSSIDKCLRFRDRELVKKELKFFMDANVPQVKFVDRTFNCNHTHAMAIWTYIMEQDRGITNFHFEIAADLLNEEEIALIEKMRPGLIQLEIGVQSTNEKTVKEIRRTMDFEEVKRIVKRINAGGNVHQHLDLIVGLPYEGMESFIQSYNDVYALEPEQLQLGFLKVLKGSYMETQKQAYGLVHKSIPPYEVLFTKWLSYRELLELKSVEEMTEVYYNSGQFQYTIKALLHHFLSPYELYRGLGAFYEEKGYNLISHSRITRYEILLAFVEESVEREKREAYKELLTLDLYLRENVKNRPGFAGESTVDKGWAQEFYEAESIKRTYLKNYEGYDKRQLRKMTHLEHFQYEVLGDLEKKENYVLFDYQNRSPLNHQAYTVRLEK